jgi:integrase
MNKEVRGELLLLKQATEDGGFVFTSARTGVNLTEVKRAFKRACREAEIENLRFHDLRHTVATRLKTRVDAFTLRDLLGHATIRMTGDYTHATPEDLQEAVSLLDGRPGEVIELERRRKA